MQRFGPETSPDTYGIIGACLEVHHELGTGFLEGIYQEALAIEFADRNIQFEREPGVVITYKGRALSKCYRPDFVCDGSTIVELKAHNGLGASDLAQVSHYLKATGLKLALLVNFGQKELEVRRFVL